MTGLDQQFEMPLMRTYGLVFQAIASSAASVASVERMQATKSAGRASEASLHTFCTVSGPDPNS